MGGWKHTLPFCPCMEKYGKMSGVRDLDLLAFESSRRPVSVTTCFLISWVASVARKVKHICSITNSTSASSWKFKTNYAFPPYLQPQPQPTLCSSKRGKQCFLMHLNAFKWYSRWSKQITSFTEVQHQPTSWLPQQLTVLRVVPEGLMCREQLTPNRPNPWLSKAPLNFGAEGCSNLSSSMFEIETSAPQFVLKFSYWAPSRPGTWQEKESTRRQCPFESSWTDCHLFNTIAKQHSLVVLGHDCDAAAIHRSWAWILLLHTSLDPQWPESEGCLESASPIHWPRKLRDFHNFIRLPCVSGDDRSQTSILANWSGGNSFKAAAISSGVLPSIAVLASWRCWLGVSWAVPFRSPYQDSGHVGDRLAALKDSIKTHW